MNAVAPRTLPTSTRADVDTRARTTALLAVAALVVTAWLATALAGSSFGIGTYITSSWAAAAAWATTIVSYLNSWWGFAMAVAFAAGFGGSWVVVLIKGVLQKAGFKFAVQYATWL